LENYRNDAVMVEVEAVGRGYLDPGED